MSSVPLIKSQPTPPKSLKGSLSQHQKFVLITIVNVTCFFIVWELIARYSGIPSIFLPRFSAIIADIPRMTAEGILLPNLWVSFKNFVIGMAIGTLVGVPLGFGTGAVKVLDRTVSPYLWAFYSMPRIILVPLVFLWVGINNNARLVIVIISVIPQVAVVIMDGVKTTSNSLLQVGKSFGADRWKLLTQVMLPSSVPFIGTGVRLGTLRGLIGLFVGEMFITSDGIGSIISYARAKFDMDRVFAVLLIFVVFSVLCLALTRVWESSVSQWRGETQF
jgi:ABC-type nitrate/sulfonate/bicarbonate transport system permease component